MRPDDPAYAGQSEYEPWFLRIYDPLVLGFFARVVWRCPSSRIIDLYQRHLGRRHLDIGPGTGYFIEKANPVGPITLLDPNPNVLAHTERRLRHLDVSSLEADVCKPMPAIGPFDSVAMNYVFHCLPSSTGCKAAAVSNAAAALAADGVLFGATVLGTPSLHTVASRPALKANNKRGVFDNTGDTEATLSEALSTAFAGTSIDIVGAVALFTAVGPNHVHP